MHNLKTSHPDRETLADFGLGRLESAESSWIEEHLSACEECCDTLLNLKDDTFTGLLRTIPFEEENGSEVETPDSVNVQATPDQTDTMLVESRGARESLALPPELLNHPRYRIISQIGQGGMGSVYRAQHRLMNRPVALKLINSELIRHPQAVERFQREVQAAAQLAHPNIVAAYDAERAADVHFLVMEFVDGTDLNAVVRDRGALPIAECCEYVRQAALGLQHAYEKGMVHRDIKPANLMLSPDGQVRILDFGLAAFATEESYFDAVSPEGSTETVSRHLTSIGSLMGTPDYIAPEQARDAHSADIRADIYSLGCTLHFLLSGRPVFEADSVVDKLNAHATADWPKLKDSRDDAPPELQDVLDRMLAKDPADRFQTPFEAVEALARFVEPEAVPTPAAESQPASRRPAGTLLASLIAFVAAVIIVATTQGNFEIRSDVDGVQVTVSKEGKTFRVLDVNSGTSVFWLPSDEFQVKARGDADVSVSQDTVQVNWMGRQVIRIRRASDATGEPAHPPVPQERGRSRLFEAIVRQDGGETVLQRIAAISKVPGAEISFVGQFGSAPRHSLLYWAHGARIRVTATREVAGRYLRQLKAALEATTQTHGVRLLDASVGESGGHLSAFGAGFTDGHFYGDISAALTAQPALDDSSDRVWDILVTVREWPGKERPDAVEKPYYPELLHDFDGHLFGSNGRLALSPNGKLLATSGNDVRFWDVSKNGTPLRSAALPNTTCIVFLKHDPRLAAIGTAHFGIADQESRGKVFLWNHVLSAFVSEVRFKDGEVRDLALSPDGRHLAVGVAHSENGQALLWDLESDEKYVLIADEPVSHVAFTPDGRFVLSATAEERGTLRLFNVATRQQESHLDSVLSVGRFLRAVDVSPDSRQLAVAGGNWREKDGRFLLLNLPDLTIQRREVCGETEVRSIAYSPDGRLLATGGGSGRGEVVLLDSRTLEERTRFIAYEPRPAVLRQIVSGIAFSPDGHSLFTSADHEGIRLWKLPETLRALGGGNEEADEVQGP